MNEETLTIWLDTALLMLGGFVLMAVLMLALVNPPQKQSAEEIKPPGELTFEIRWGDNLDADIDLWVLAPGDTPVGYSAKQSRVMNLLRDDLGNGNNLGSLRYENAYSRDTPPGTYCANAASYRVGSITLYPLNVDWQVTIRRPTGILVTLAKGQVTFERTAQEITLVCFTLDENKEIVSGSLNHVYHPIWKR